MVSRRRWTRGEIQLLAGLQPANRQAVGGLFV
jgi:hypothetical protein